MHGADCIGLLILLWLFRKGVNDLADDASQQKTRSKNLKSKSDNKTPKTSKMSDQHAHDGKVANLTEIACTRASKRMAKQT